MCTSDLIRYWPGAAAVLVAAFLILQMLGMLGFIDDVVHLSLFERYRTENKAEHDLLRQTIQGVESDVREIRRSSDTIGSTLYRIEMQTKGK